MAGTKNLLTFRNKMSHFNGDLDFVDILSKIVQEGMFSSDEELFPGTKNEKYTVLSSYKVGDQNRRMVINHLKSTVYTAYIKDLYEEFTIYLKGILKEVYDNSKVKPERITGEHKVSMSSVDILNHLQVGDLADIVIDQIFQSLENERSTISLITKFHKKIGIAVNDAIINKAMYYLEIRHKLVHTDGIADEDFKNNHPSLIYTDRNRIKLDYNTICSAYEAVFNLVYDIDVKVIQAGLARRNN